ncbi:MAG: hypothetical protein M3243_02160 [Thermoproteota archaeon]|nr:hypothetical protein [Thermoproteota archaeon]
MAKGKTIYAPPPRLYESTMQRAKQFAKKLFPVTTAAQKRKEKKDKESGGAEHSRA